MYPARVFFLFVFTLVRGMVALLYSSREACALRLGAFEQVLARIFRSDPLQLPQQFLHTFVHRFRHHYLQFDVLIPALSGLANRRNALLAQAQLLTAVG